MRNSIAILSVVICAFGFFPCASAARQPNIIILLADDLGYGDLGVTGSKQIPTPHIDSLAANGVRFTNAYVSSPVCAPSRAGLMTGKHQASFGFRDNLAPVQPGHDPETVGLPVNQTTLAERLKALGYATGLVGKWHLGERPQFHPMKRGFDEFWGWLGGSHDYFRAEPGGEKQMAGPILCNYKDQGAITYLTDDQGDECVGFIRRHKDRPFFLFASFAAPHSPMQATVADLERFSHIEDKLAPWFTGSIRTSGKSSPNCERWTWNATPSSCSSATTVAPVSRA
jgi:arylsulfatase A-like enzyme